ncbi:hypothetical protein L202_08387 [Cryptococcus amylolentus CBS 6039]|uniref:Uncharacterized protein n=2 Tax=Cryptococcus amylolentus TaxID=104669 RepID=A0A1E3H9H9_9TREE|nr:hypothetical protein L202_08387 [Cryptococcus amylolentus CBS 6039]ODN72989.1 hypothetical protein L202_08387 [Cryptococcus amylolentus CBS 6039]ODN98148.1 hypothetical protein I350_07791 [Cryptococcus amylolentus CBS 6273]
MSNASLKPPLPPKFALPPQLLAQAADAYRQPAPPPSLPPAQNLMRHQDPSHDPQDKNPSQPNGPGVGVVRCPEQRPWQERQRHAGEKLARFEEWEVDHFVADLSMVLRKEYDCWVEQCWQEAFHHVFTHTLPELIINLIMSGATPTFLRRNVVFGGQSLDHLFQSQMLHILFEELEHRLCGDRPHADPGPSKPSAPASKFSPFPFAAPPPPAPPIFRDGVCFHNLACDHGIPEEEDNHGACLCQLTTCMACFGHYAVYRRGPISLLPHELLNTPAAKGWLGGVETEAHARARQASLRRQTQTTQALPPGKGFVQMPKPQPPTATKTQNPEQNKVLPKPPQIFPHPQMTDVLAVEEHLRWRLKELGAGDKAVENRYGPSGNNPIALEGVGLPNVQEDVEEEPKPNTTPSKNMKMAKVKGKGKLRRVPVSTNNIKKDKDGKEVKKAIVYLPKEWTDVVASERNTATVLTFRHFVKLLHQIAMAASPFSHPDYPTDIEELERMHPVALYRRLAEPAVERRWGAEEAKGWRVCMDKWGEEFGGKERKKGNDASSGKDHSSAIKHYTRAISLDPKKTVYYSNRAIAYNNLGLHGHAELDCTFLLSKDPKNAKALYQRALSRKGMGRWREAEGDLEELMRWGESESARALLAQVREKSDGEVV